MMSRKHAGTVPNAWSERTRPANGVWTISGCGGYLE